MATAPRLFTADALWNRRLPTNTPAHANSSQLLTTLRGIIANDFPTLSMSTWGMPIYYTKATDPIYYVVNGGSSSYPGYYDGMPDIIKPGGAGIKLAPGCKGNEEGAATVIDRTTWTNPQTGKVGGNWIIAFHQKDIPIWTGSGYRADGGGVYYLNSNGLDYRSGDLYPNNTLPSMPRQNQTSGRGIPNNVRAGFRKEQYQAGEIDHVLGMFIQSPPSGAPSTGTSDAKCFPVLKGEDDQPIGWKEGMRLVLRRSVNIDTLCGPVGSARWILAKGLQEYGVYFHDQSGGNAIMKIESTGVIMNGSSDWSGTNITSPTALSGIPFTDANWFITPEGWEPPLGTSPPPPPSPPAPPPPSPPVGTRPTIGTLSLGSKTTSSITLNWTAASAPSTDPVTTYTLYQVGISSAIATMGGTVRSRTVSGLTPATSYSFQLTATNGAGESTRSNTVTTTTDATSPPPPPGVGQWPGHKTGLIYLGTSEVEGRSTDATVADIGGPLGAEREYFINYNDAADEDLFISTAHSKDRLPWLSYRVSQTDSTMLTDWGTIASGASDTAIRARARRYADHGRPIIVSWNAQPDRTGTTATHYSNWRSAWTRIYDLFASEGATANVSFVPVITDEVWLTGNPLDWISNAMLDRMPFLGVRCDKPDNSNQTYADRLPPILNWLNSRGYASKMLGISITSGFNSTGQTGAQWWTTSWTYAKANSTRIGVITYHNTNASPPPTGSHLLSESAAKLAAFGASANDPTTTNLAAASPPPPPPPGTPPSAPTGVTVSGVGDGSIALSWNPVTNVDTYQVYQGTGTTTLLGETATEFITLNGLTNGQSYTLTVRATNSQGQSSASSSVTATPFGTSPPPPPGPPPPPVGSIRFRVGSPWETPLPANAPIHGSSATWITALDAATVPTFNGHSYFALSGGADTAFGTTTDSTLPLYRVTASTPNYHLVLGPNATGWVNPRFLVGGQGVRIPSTAKTFYAPQSATAGNTMLVYDVERGYYASLNGMQWEAGATPADNSDADRTGRWVIGAVGTGQTAISLTSSYGIGSHTEDVGTTAKPSFWPTNLRTLAGPNTGPDPAEYQDSPENHGLSGANMGTRVIDYSRLNADQLLGFAAQAVVFQSAASARFPLTTAPATSTGAVPEGTRLRIKQSVDVAARLNGDTSQFGVAGARTAAQQAALNEATWIARGLQQFGVIVTQRSSSSGNLLRLESRYKEGLTPNWRVPIAGLRTLPFTDWEFVADDFHDLVVSPPPPPPAGPPTAPTNLTVTLVASGQVTLDWTESITDPATPITGYQVYSGTGTGTPLGASTLQTQTAITGLTNGTTYTFTVRASNSAGQSVASNSVSATPAGVPVAPTGLAQTGSTQTVITMGWSAVADPSNAPVQGYRVYQIGVLEPVVDTAALTTSVTGLMTGSTYTFRVAAYNRVGEGPMSSAVNMTTQGTSPPPPAPPPPGPPPGTFAMWETDTPIPQAGPVPSAPSGLSVSDTGA